MEAARLLDDLFERTTIADLAREGTRKKRDLLAWSGPMSGADRGV
jgi:hypothetical protein